MKLYRLPDGWPEILDGAPEAAMGVHLIRAGKSTLLLALGGEILLDPRRETNRAAENLLNEPWLAPPSLESDQVRVGRFDRWLAQLTPWAGDDELSVVSLDAARVLMWGGLRPSPGLGASLAHGHLPFAGAAVGDAVFYRWEPWPRSRRIDQATGQIAAGTFTAPFSEAPFAPTGFSAVARFALPNLAPACFRWELRPPGGTGFRCGASVPLYGQSGGGVEAEFTLGFHNVGPIANPVVLAPL